MFDRWTASVLIPFALICASAIAGVDPRVEINLGPVPVDRYYAPGYGYSAYMYNTEEGTQNSSTPPLLAGCRDGTNIHKDWTIQQCIRSYFYNDSTADPYFRQRNYRRQGVTGVRFQFGLGGGAHSTAFEKDGNVRQEWKDRLRQLFVDLRSYWIVRVTPTPVFLENWSAAYCLPKFDASGSIRYPREDSSPCESLRVVPEPNALGLGGKPLRFLKWVPFGVIHETDVHF